MDETTAKLSDINLSEGSGRSTARRDFLIGVERKYQQKWKQNQVFQSEVDLAKPKYLCTFPYPYMNGFLHIGHGFSLSKVEFAARYHRLKGENVLFPFGLHCTGMPIQAAANQLKREIEQFGCPPDFSTDVAQQKVEVKKDASLNKAKGKKSKLAAKTGNVVRRWDIMKMMVPEEEIPKFVDPMHWLSYFPPHAQQDLELFGVNVDWRRTFITTDVNPFYDAFIKWQLNTLKKKNRISRGKRPNVYSPLDQQICADHDRSSGEGVNPQEYTIVKLEVQQPYPEGSKLHELVGKFKKVFLAPATLRPETMYGQTNCFVLPEGDYGAYILKNPEEVYIMSRRAARNLAHQDQSRNWGVEEEVLQMKGSDLLGCALSAPYCKYSTIYTLPLLSISMSKGTGVVTSVPSDSPDDYAALRDLQKKADFRAKFNLSDEMVLPFEVVPIIHIDGYGDTAAVAVCDTLKIKSQNDKDKLAKAKELVYMKGFYEGVMLVGSQKGVKVCDAKPAVRAELLEAGLAFSYWEAESTVMSRSGDECVVAHLDQWYLMYGAEDWQKKVTDFVKDPSKFTSYNPMAQTEYLATLGWLKEWAPCRQFGLGTKLPWDPQFVVESLSDSTIYMAYYTIAHYLQGNFDGSKRGSFDIDPKSLTDEVFDYIFLKGDYPSNCSIEESKLSTMRNEFEYWYPIDLRGSGKDLIRNHLTMSLYNHAEIWGHDDKYWPKSFFTNGHVLVDAEKMSKSKGNFLSIKDCIEAYGSDCTRFATADAGDSMDDANFARDTANAAILRLTTEEEWIKSILSPSSQAGLRSESSPLNFNDQVFHHQMNRLINETAHNFDNMQWRDGLHSGFYSFQLARDSYRDVCVKSGISMHLKLVKRFIESQIIMLAPICPHFAEHVWENLLNKDGFVSRDALWPVVEEEVNFSLLRAQDFLTKCVKTFRERSDMNNKKNKKQKTVEVAKPTHAQVYLASDFPMWQQTVLKFLSSVVESDDKNKVSFPKDLMAQLKKNVINADDDLKKQTKQIMQFAAFVVKEAAERGTEALELSMPYDQKQVLIDNKAYLLRVLELQDITFHYVDKDEVLPSDADEKRMASAGPGKACAYFYTQ